MIAIEEIIKGYDPKTAEETKLVLREIIQQVVLVGLAKGNFFELASFYGGTALRIFYGLNRYSEDLDFTLNVPDPSFSIEPYMEKIKEVAASYGLELELIANNKKIATPIESAFAKLNTYQAFVKLKVDERLVRILHKDELIKVKFEVDTKPALGFNISSRWLDVPEFANVAVLDEESLFAGKLHAILCRNYKNTVKGRDYYDFIFYMQRRIKPNMNYLRNKLIDSKAIGETDNFNIDLLKEMLKKKFNEVDFTQVRNDASRFLLTNEDLSFYCKDLFIQMVDRL